MSRKQKGIGYERELVHMFWKSEWAAIRVAGSGCSRYPSPDVLAGNVLRKLAIECKSSMDEHIYIPKEDICSLKKFASLFGTEAWIAVRFNKREWYFLTLEDLKETPNSYGINVNLAKQKGLLFEEFIK